MFYTLNLGQHYQQIYTCVPRDTLTRSGTSDLNQILGSYIGVNCQFETLLGYIAKSKTSWTA